MRAGMTAGMRIAALAGILLLRAGYPLCVALGLDACVGWLSNGYFPEVGEVLGAVIVLLARAMQCVVAPMLLLMWLAWELAGLAGRAVRAMMAA